MRFGIVLICLLPKKIHNGWKYFSPNSEKLRTVIQNKTNNSFNTFNTGTFMSVLNIYFRIHKCAIVLNGIQTKLVEWLYHVMIKCIMHVYTCYGVHDDIWPWASYQIRKIAGAHAPGMPGTFSLFVLTFQYFLTNVKPCVRGRWHINSSGPTEDGRDFPDDFFKCICWMKLYDVRLRVHWSLFIRAHLTIFQHWFR